MVTSVIGFTNVTNTTNGDKDRLIKEIHQVVKVKKKQSNLVVIS